MRARIVLIISILILNIGFALSGEEDPAILTLDRIFKDEEFLPEPFGPARWLKDSSGYTTLEESEGSHGHDIVLYDAETGERIIIVPAEKLIPAESEVPIEIEDYDWSADMRYLLVFTNTKRVWRRNTRGDYYVLDLKTWDLHQLGGDAGPSTLMFATFSPDSRNIGYVIKNNLYVEDLESHEMRQLTTDGSTTIINGTFDWAYEEEFSLRHGFRWSPDSKLLAYWQLDASGVGEFYLINNTDSIYSKVIPVQYPKVGTTNSACRVGVVNISEGETRWIDTPGDPRNTYIARMGWSGNSKEIVLQHLNRWQNTNQVMLADAQTGIARTVLVEKDEAWVDAVDDLKWLADGEKFTWISERSGWQSAYMISRDGGEVRQITKGDFDVIEILNIDERSGWLYYIASPENPTQRYLYRSKLNGTGEPDRLTPAGQAGTHSYEISPDTKWAIHTYSTFEQPPVKTLVRLPSHEIVRLLSENNALREKIAALNIEPAEFFRIDIGEGVKLDAWLLKPSDFDPEKKYPLFYYVYGEPCCATVKDEWPGDRGLWHRMLTQQGYVVASIDNRGTNTPRGRDWRKCVYQRIGVLATRDQAAATQVLLQERPYLDPQRIGIWGWSAGGSMTLNMLFHHPETYKTGMAVAPNPVQWLYDSIYQERYMRTREANPEGFELGSPVTHARKLKGNLLLVHGTGDDNVHYQTTEVLINELIKHNRHFSMMAYPNRTHSIKEGENTTLHLHTLLTRYLKDNLEAGANR